MKRIYFQAFAHLLVKTKGFWWVFFWFLFYNLRLSNFNIWGSIATAPCFSSQSKGSRPWRLCRCWDRQIPTKEVVHWELVIVPHLDHDIRLQMLDSLIQAPEVLLGKQQIFTINSYRFRFSAFNNPAICIGNQHVFFNVSYSMREYFIIITDYMHLY